MIPSQKRSKRYTRTTLLTALLFSAVGLLPPSPTMAATPIRILTFDATRSGTCQFVDWTFVTGNAFSSMRADLLNPANFSDQGVIPRPIEFLPPVTTLTAGALSQADIVLLSKYDDTVPLSAAELIALDSYVQQGGGLVAFYNLAPDQLGPMLGVSGISSGTACAVVSDVTSPMTHGPFGDVTGCVAEQYHRHFANPGPTGATFLADGEPAGATFLHGRGLVALIGDEEWYMSMSVPGCGLGEYNATRSRLFMNGIAFVLPANPASVPGNMPAASALSVRVVPNPGTHPGRIEFDTSRSGPVQAFVCDLAGRRIRDLFHGVLGAGHHDLAWDGRTNLGPDVRTGVYWVRVETPEGTGTARSLVVR